MKDDASVQPGKLGDCLLHETTAAWVRKLEGQTLPKEPWKERAGAYAVRLKQIVARSTAENSVDGLCRELPDRVAALYKKKGGKLKK